MLYRLTGQAVHKTDHTVYEICSIISIEEPVQAVDLDKLLSIDLRWLGWPLIEEISDDELNGLGG